MLVGALALTACDGSTKSGLLLHLQEQTRHFSHHESTGDPSFPHGDDESRRVEAGKSRRFNAFNAFSCTFDRSKRGQQELRAEKFISDSMGLRLFHRDTYMPFDLSATRHAALALIVGATLAGCGGGGSDDASLTDQTNASTSPGNSTEGTTSTSTSSPSTSSGNADATSTGSTGADTQGASSSGNVEVASAGTTTTIPTTKTTTSARFGLGMNLTSINSYSLQIPTVDLMKKASTWITQCNNGYLSCTSFTSPAKAYDTLEEASLDLDSNGWVKSLPAADSTGVKYRSVTTKIAEGGVQKAGNYTVLYEGNGTVSYSGKATKIPGQSSPGRDVIAVTNDPVGVYVNITSTDPKNYIRNIRVYAPGGACKSDLTAYVTDASKCASSTGGFVPFEKFPAGTVWHPAFLASLKNFRTLRFMDWGQTNYTQAANWTDRTAPTARSWYTTTGVPVEAMFDLAAKAGADPWMNIPPHATDDYVHQFGKLAHTLLPANRKLALEFGNELWNWSFGATRWARTQGLVAWPEQAGNPTGAQMNWYAMRLAQVCNIVKSEFGADAGRVQCVANTQAANPYVTDLVLNCAFAQKTLGQPCYKSIDAVSIAPYFGYYVGTNSATVAVMNTWYGNADGGLAQLFHEITGKDANGLAAAPPLFATRTKASTGALEEAHGWMTAQVAEVSKFNLPLWAYEGGQSLVPARGDTAMNALMIAANRDARMGAVYTTMLNDWKAAGGQTFAMFADVGGYGPGGSWGLRENQFDTSTPKWKATVQWNESQPCWWTGC